MPQYHPYANIFPMIEGAAFEDLVADIRANGPCDPVDMFEGMILDGRNRSRACAVLGIDPPQRDFQGTSEQALAYVISKNLKRRHLNDDQRRMVAARLATMGRGRPSEEKPAECGIKVSAAAQMINVDEAGTERARTVLLNAAPEVQEAVDHGKLSVAAAAQAAKLAPETQRKIAEEAEAGRTNVVRTVLKKETRDAREKKLADKQRDLPKRKFGVILADPEWRFEPYSRETGMDRSPDNHYPTSETFDIITRPVKNIAAKDAVLFLWATAPMLPAALRVMEGWGFTYKTHLIWHKTRNGDGRGSGYWFTGEHELLLVGTCGSIPAPATAACASIIAAPWQGRHSAKPECFAELIERLFPNMPKIELNRRGPPREGWEAWGNEAETGEYDTETGECHDDLHDGNAVAPGSGAPACIEQLVEELLEHPGFAIAAEPADEDRPNPPGSLPDAGVVSHETNRAAPGAEAEGDILDIPAFLRRTPENKVPA